MAVQTRIQLQNKSAIVQNETVANANTALRVGGLFDDFADSVTLNSERGLMTLYVDSPVSYNPSTSTQAVLNVSMTEGPSFGSVFSSSEFAITYNGAISAPIRISVQLTFAGTNNRRYSFWIAQDGNIITQSLSENTTQGTHNHFICAEAFVVANTGSYFEIYAYSNSSNPISITTLNFAAFTI